MVQQWELGQLGQGKGVARGNPGLIIQSLDDYTSNWYSIYKLDQHIMQLCLQKTIWFPRLLSRYTKLHTLKPSYPQYASYQIGHHKHQISENT